MYNVYLYTWLEWYPLAKKDTLKEKCGGANFSYDIIEILELIMVFSLYSSMTLCDWFRHLISTNCYIDTLLKIFAAVHALGWLTSGNGLSIFLFVTF